MLYAFLMSPHCSPMSFQLIGVHGSIASHWLRAGRN